MIFIESINELLETRKRCGKTQVIAIDGRAGSGKTTLASELSLAFSLDKTVTILHMDEIYSGWHDALGPTLSRTLGALLASISVGHAIELPIFDWNRGEYFSSRVIEPSELLILEGVGSAQNTVRAFDSTTIWLDIDAAIGLERVLKRDGMNILPQMQRWQLDEDLHFSQDETRENSDFILST